MIIKDCGVQAYQETWQAMQAFTCERTPSTQDEIWLVQHPRVFTLGTAGKKKHILNAHDIPIVQSDRGGQVTYHGPGQLIAYTLWDIKRANIGLRDLVCRLEQAVITLLNHYHITALGNRLRPGVYVNHQKIAAIGLRIKKKGCYHGMSLNVDMDLTPFSYINPCGYSELTVTQLKDHVANITVEQVKPLLSKQLVALFSP
jgi:lipoyl(octanoyl) transferase